MTTAVDLTVRSQTTIRAPRSKIWRALTTASEFAKWFGCEIVSGDFVPGSRVDMISRGKCSPDQHFYVALDRMEPEHTFTWRWVPGSREPEEDLSGEGETHVEFRLEEVEGGTLVSVVETGFDRVSLGRRARVLEQNQHGWDAQLISLNQYVSQAA